MPALLCAALFVSGLAAAQPATPTATKTVSVDRAALDEFAIKAGGVVFNNFQLAEQPSRGVRAANPEHEAPDIAVRGMFRNGTGQWAEYTLVVVGVDAGGEFLWACHMPGSAPARDVGVFHGAAAVPRDTLRLTAAVRIRARLAPPPESRPSVPLPGAARP